MEYRALLKEGSQTISQVNQVKNFYNELDKWTEKLNKQLDQLNKEFNQTGNHPTEVQVGELSRQYVIVNGGLEHIQKLKTDWEAYNLAPGDFPLFEGKETSRTVEKLAHAYLTKQQERLETEKAKEEAAKAKKAKKKKGAADTSAPEQTTSPEKATDKSRSPSTERKGIVRIIKSFMPGFTKIHCKRHLLQPTQSLARLQHPLMQLQL